MATPISKTQPMRSAEIDIVNYINNTVASAVELISALPSFEFGYSDAITLAKDSATTFDVVFANAKTEPPQLLVSVQANTSEPITAEVQYTTTTGARIAVFNFGSTKVQNITVDWLAISGR